MFSYSEFNKSKIHKKYRKDGEIFLQLLVTKEDDNKVIVVDLPYRLYKLQKKFRFILPPGYDLYPKDGNVKNYRIENIGLMSEGKTFNIDTSYFYTAKKRYEGIINSEDILEKRSA